MEKVRKILVAGLLTIAVTIPTAVAVIHDPAPQQSVVRIAAGPTSTPGGGSTYSSGGCQGGGC